MPASRVFTWTGMESHQAGPSSRVDTEAESQLSAQVLLDGDLDSFRASLVLESLLPEVMVLYNTSSKSLAAPPKPSSFQQAIQCKGVSKN
jgi:hypothetical protein